MRRPLITLLLLSCIAPAIGWAQAGHALTDANEQVDEATAPVSTATEAVSETPDKPLNLDRLWLPSSYTKYWSNLRHIAEMQLASGRCTEVIRGELARAESSETQPVFAIMCRDNLRTTYVEKFDGLVLESYEQAIIRPPEPEPTEEEAVLELEPEPEPDISLAIYAACQNQWQSDVKLMQKLVWLDALEPVVPMAAEEDAEGVVHYSARRRFNARNAAGVELRYLAVCEATSLADVRTRIDIRRTP